MASAVDIMRAALAQRGPAPAPVVQPTAQPAQGLSATEIMRRALGRSIAIPKPTPPQEQPFNFNFAPSAAGTQAADAQAGLGQSLPPSAPPAIGWNALLPEAESDFQYSFSPTDAGTGSTITEKEPPSTSKKPFNIGLNLSGIDPATTPAGVVGKNIVGGGLASLVNVPGALATGALKTYLPALGEAAGMSVPSFMKKGAGEVVSGLKGLLEGGKRQDFMESGPDLERVPRETFGMAPEKKTPSAFLPAAKALGAAGEVVGGAFNTLGAGELMEKSARSFKEMAPPVPETPSVGWNVAGGIPAVAGETLTEGLAAAVPVERAAFAAARLGKAATTAFRKPVVDASKAIEDLNALPTRAMVEEHRAMTTGESGFNPALAELEKRQLADSYPPGTLTNRDLKAMSEMSAEDFEKYMAEQAQKLKRAGIEEAPEVAKISTAAERERQQFLDGLAQQGQDFQGAIGQKFGDDIGIGDNWLMPTASPKIAPAVEWVNRTFEKVALVTEKFQAGRQQMIDLLKKSKGPLWIRDKASEARVAKALDGKFDAAMLLPQERQAYEIGRVTLDKLADLEGLKESVKYLSDYFPHMLPKESLMAKEFAKHGFLYDPMSGALVKPSESGFHKMRKAEGEGLKGYSYDLNEVMAARINTGVRKAYLDPIMWDVQSIQSTLPEGIKEYLGAWADRLQGRPDRVERALDKAIEKLVPTKWAAGLAAKSKSPIMQGLMKRIVAAGLPGTSRRAASVINKAFYRWMLGGALDTAAKNALQGINVGGAQGPLRMARGYYDMLTPRGRKALEESGAIKDLMAIQEHQADMVSSSKLLKGIDNILFTPMQVVEYINRSAAYHGAMAEAAEVLAKQGIKNPPHWMLDRYAKAKGIDPTQFKYGPANKNPFWNNPVGAMIYQFATYPANQVNFMRSLWHDKNGQWKVPGTKRSIPYKLLRLWALQGMTIMGAKEMFDIDLADTMGWSDKLPFKSPVPLPAVGNLQQVVGRLPGLEAAAERPASMVSPSTALASSGLAGLRGEDTKGKLGEMFSAGILGSLARMPGRPIGNLERLMQEEREKVVRSKSSGKVLYPLKEGEATKRFYGLRPGSQVDFEKRMKEKKERSAERRQKQKEAINGD